jgi:plasmid maintenance system killer protein
MIRDKHSFLHQGLKQLWEKPGSKPAKLDSTLLKRVGITLGHLETASNSRDLAEGLGETRHYHKLNNGRYSLDVNGNFRITFELVDDKTGEVTKIDLEDTH